MVYAEFGGQTECIMGNSKIENCRGGTIFICNYFFRGGGEGVKVWTTTTTTSALFA